MNQTGSAGGGGEYDVQTGFGWSNGVVIEFMAIFGDELLKDNADAEAEYSNTKFKEEIVLNTHFETSRGRSTLMKRDSNVNILPEKHELEQSEKMMNHPALSIEEDEEPNGSSSSANDFELPAGGAESLNVRSDRPIHSSITSNGSSRDEVAKLSFDTETSSSSSFEEESPLFGAAPLTPVPEQQSLTSELSDLPEMPQQFEKEPRANSYGPASLPPCPNRTKNLISFFEKKNGQ